MKAYEDEKKYPPIRYYITKGLILARMGKIEESKEALIEAASIVGDGKGYFERTYNWVKGNGIYYIVDDLYDTEFKFFKIYRKVLYSDSFRNRIIDLYDRKSKAIEDCIFNYVAEREYNEKEIISPLILIKDEIKAIAIEYRENEKNYNSSKSIEKLAVENNIIIENKVEQINENKSEIKIQKIEKPKDIKHDSKELIKTSLKIPDRASCSCCLIY
jgi:hypothetical protein